MHDKQNIKKVLAVKCKRLIYYNKDRLNQSHNKLHVFTVMPMDITIQNQSINSLQIMFVDFTCQQSYYA